MTSTENGRTNIHLLKSRAFTLNMSAKKLTYKITKCKPKETTMAMMRYGLDHGGMVTKLPSLDKAFRALNISIEASTDSKSLNGVCFYSVKYL